ncbi:MULTISPECIES: DUF4400 domain-containing protein [Pandoraea]|uniref:DUF4400 domain-containing protein n=2 Tax=Pandoraea TaxID=93217 RepID=A0A5E4XLN4_9BURK|nr:MULTISPECIES: DUF4400 domain-containing protein [Pandoraea]VVE14232.1 hypothetical protein PCE31107_02803 [Pandoraea cepalis]VVE37140.1 hypothetical protein PTE31013_03987 [Pandoraea terrigena]
MAKIRDNPFAGKVYFWWIIAPILTLLICPMFMPSDSFKIAPSELAFVTSSRSNVDAITKSATGVFQSWFVNTGMVGLTVNDYQKAQASGYKGYAWAGSIMDGYMERVWRYMYRVIWRWTAFWPFYVVGLVGIFLPCVVDGVVVRSVKRSEFGLYNPISFNLSASAAAIFIGWLFFVPFSPWPLGHWIVSSLFLGLGLMTWFTVGNFQSRS